jgi:hypothetical protein
MIDEDKFKERYDLAMERVCSSKRSAADAVLEDYPLYDDTEEYETLQRDLGKFLELKTELFWFYASPNVLINIYPVVLP